MDSQDRLLDYQLFFSYKLVQQAISLILIKLVDLSLVKSPITLNLKSLKDLHSKGKFKVFFEARCISELPQGDQIQKIFEKEDSQNNEDMAVLK